MNAHAWLATHWTTILGLAPWVVGAIFAWSGCPAPSAEALSDNLRRV